MSVAFSLYCNATGLPLEVLRGLGYNENVSDLFHYFNNSGACDFVQANSTMPTPTRSTGSEAINYIVVSLFALICVAGLIGNGLVIFVILRYSKMKTVTNVYIFNLSVADTVFLCGLPLIMATAVLHRWVFGFTMCKIYYICTCINMFTGAFTLTAMSGDRFVAVCFPIASLNYRTVRNAGFAVALTWIMSFLMMIPIILYAKTTGSNGRYSCHIDWPKNGVIPPGMAYVFYTLTIGFVAPVLIISVLYTLLVIRLRKTGPRQRSAEKKRSHRKVTRLVTSIIAIYICCWLPYYVFQIYLIFKGKGRLPPWKLYLYQLVTVLSYANSAVNPLLYAFTNEQFRESFLNAFKCAADSFRGPGRRTSDVTATTTANNNLLSRNTAANGANETIKLSPMSKPEAKTEEKKYEFKAVNNSVET